jgi:hypothetical protein
MSELEKISSPISSFLVEENKAQSRSETFSVSQLSQLSCQIQRYVHTHEVINIHANYKKLQLMEGEGTQMQF